MEPEKTFEEKEKAYKLKELELKIKELEAPFYTKPSFLLSFLAFVVSAVGVVGQNYASKYELKKAEYDKLIASDSVSKARKFLEKARAENASLSVYKDSIETVVNEKRRALAALTAEYEAKTVETNRDLATITSKIESSGLSQVQRAELSNLVVKTKTQLNKVSPRVYIQIASESQRGPAKQLQDMLRASNGSYILPGTENVGAKSPTRGEVRYYYDEDAAGASDIVAAMRKLSIDTKDPVRMPGNGRGTRPGHYEVWFPK